MQAVDYPKQSDQALHHCLYNRKSVKNYCESNSLAFTNKNETGRGEPESHQNKSQCVKKNPHRKQRASDSELVPSPWWSDNNFYEKNRNKEEIKRKKIKNFLKK